ncbi:cytochrome c [Lewinella sp. JB7]|uniref:c-type cytochrome n=1 Tax=Lewinella sp. JB7 TaxID=2962887 RepID=UPI0020C9B6E8|nr:cytochrome c [Lewinella sp. JB7]MCP9235324.1 cytochrome c [Lewinella sp. JB7]
MRRFALLSLTACVILLLGFACGQTEHLQGKALYATHCSNCHLDEGQGLRQLIPPLAGSDYLRERPADVVRGIRHGMAGPMLVNGVTYDHPMPANVDLTDFQIVNIVNYINTAWGNQYDLVTVSEVRSWLSTE